MSDIVDTTMATSADLSDHCLDAARAACALLNQTTGATGYASIKDAYSDDVSRTRTLSVGETRAMLRLFHWGDPLAEGAFRRAIELHAAMGGSCLLPPILGVSKKHGAVLQELIEGEALPDILSHRNAETWSGALGQWFGQFAFQAPKTDTVNNWYDYLSLFFVDDSTQLAPHKRFLKQTPIRNLVYGSFKISLGDFVPQANGSVIRRKDPAYTLKPDLWEFLVCARSLLKRTDLSESKIIESLTKGWRSEYPNAAISQYRLTKLLSIFCELRPMNANVFKQTKAARYADVINEIDGRDAPEVQSAFLSPHFNNHLVDVDLQLIEEFRAHLHEVIKGAAQAPKETPSRGVRNNAAQKPSALVSAFCKACAGNCCSHGQENFAYLSRDDLRSVQSMNPGQSASDVIDTYITHIPKKHVKESCLYHGDKGCALPRQMRSFTCNGYLCSHARFAKNREFAVPEQGCHIAIVSIDDHRNVSAHLFGNGALTEIDISLS